MFSIEKARNLILKTNETEKFDFSKKVNESLKDYNSRIKKALENKTGIFVFPEAILNNVNEKTGKKNFENWAIRPSFSVIENMEDIIGTDIFKEKEGDLSIRRNGIVHYFGIKDDEIIRLISQEYFSKPGQYGEATRFYIDPECFYIGKPRLLESLSPAIPSLQETQA